MKKIYFNEYNLLMGSGGIVYLPIVSGILSAHIKTSEIVQKEYEVMPFIFVQMKKLFIYLYLTKKDKSLEI